MSLLGIDLGTSSVKVCVTDIEGKVIASAQFPREEAEVQSPKPGWAEQSPELWWENFAGALALCARETRINLKDITAIGIAYQMHGLVLIDRSGSVLRPAIIWSDSRAVAIGEKAASDLGEQYCAEHLLQSPGNFTASKLAWVKANEPRIYEQIFKVLLPGDYLAFRLTGTFGTTITGLSEGILFDFKAREISEKLIQYFGFDSSFFPAVLDSFATHGEVSAEVASSLGFSSGTPVSYKAGDQPNNAMSLGAKHAGEAAINAGTSGVIYAVAEHPVHDGASRINTFAHVNYEVSRPVYGVLLCINGAGSMNRFIKRLLSEPSYNELNDLAKKVEVGSNGLLIIPFGNGAERMLKNRQIGAHFAGIDLNVHTKAHFANAAQEGIAACFRYGLDIMRQQRVAPSVLKAGNTNLFLSPVFCSMLANLTGLPIEIYDGDGARGAALGAGMGSRVYHSLAEATSQVKRIRTVEPNLMLVNEVTDFYGKWETAVNNILDFN